MDDSQAGNPHAIDPKTTGLRCRVRVGSADGVLAVVPHLLGFHPSDSLVMLGIGGAPPKHTPASPAEHRRSPSAGEAAETVTPTPTPGSPPLRSRAAVVGS